MPPPLAATISSSSLGMQAPPPPLAPNNYINPNLFFANSQTVSVSQLRHVPPPPTHGLPLLPSTSTSTSSSNTATSLMPPPPNQFPLVYWFPTTPPVSPTQTLYLQQQQQASVVSPPWVLILKGAPLGINKTDILQFFSGYDLLPDFIQIQPIAETFMSDAFVTFSNRNEAERALIGKNYQKIGNNSVELFLAL